MRMRRRRRVTYETAAELLLGENMKTRPSSAESASMSHTLGCDAFGTFCCASTTERRMARSPTKRRGPTEKGNGAKGRAKGGKRGKGGQSRWPRGPQTRAKRPRTWRLATYISRHSDIHTSKPHGNNRGDDGASNGVSKSTPKPPWTYREEEMSSSIGAPSGARSSPPGPRSAGSKCAVCRAAWRPR